MKLLLVHHETHGGERLRGSRGRESIKSGAAPCTVKDTYRVGHLTSYHTVVFDICNLEMVQLQRHFTRVDGGVNALCRLTNEAISNPHLLARVTYFSVRSKDTTRATANVQSQ